jgi:hypothetical protein
MATRRIKMSDAVTAKLKELAAQASGTVKIGFIDSDQAPIAFWNEFGHKGRFPAPPRPFFRTMVANDSPKWPEMMASALRRTHMDGKRTLEEMGEHIDGALKESIIDLVAPPLSKTTLRLRLKYGNHPEEIRARDVIEAQREVAAGAPIASGTQAKPLIWTGQMLKATSYQVVAKERV